MRLDAPIFCLTADTDWASDACIADVADTAASFGIRPVFMATNKSDELDRRYAERQIELGLHPNFRPGSDHGSSYEEVIDHIHGLFPQASTFRSHSFMDGSPIVAAMLKRGIRYDSNLCLWMQGDIVPLQHATGMLRLPVFWEDDVHWERMGGDWQLTDDVLGKFLTPGLKILNTHPHNFAMNVANGEQYKAILGPHKTLSAEDIAARRRGGNGVRTFLISLLRRLRELGHRFYTLGEIHQMFTKQQMAAAATDAGRANVYNDRDHAAYWQMDNQARQELLKSDYDKRNAADPYATSRDYNARELEIEAIARNLPEGDILDLGCGNGYTLVSLAQRFPDRRMTGIDFSARMIEGALELAKPLVSPPRFVCADAVSYVQKTAAASFDGIITERFLINLPDKDLQHSVLSQIARCLRPGGRLLMCEGSLAGFAALNKLRLAMGLDAIKETSADNLSSIRFDDEALEKFAADRLGLRLTAKLGFSTYFTVSRALHPRLIAPQAPRFSDRINDVARELQMALPFAPDIGSNVLWVFTQSK